MKSKQEQDVGSFSGLEIRLIDVMMVPLFGHAVAPIRLPSAQEGKANDYERGNARVFNDRMRIVHGVVVGDIASG